MKKIVGLYRKNNFQYTQVYYICTQTHTHSQEDINTKMYFLQNDKNFCSIVIHPPHAHCLMNTHTTLTLWAMQIWLYCLFRVNEATNLFSFIFPLYTPFIALLAPQCSKYIHTYLFYVACLIHTGKPAKQQLPIYFHKHTHTTINSSYTHTFT